MQVIDLKGDPENPLSEQMATVESRGVSKEVRLDIVDRWPLIGEYVIIHAGFAIHTLRPEEAGANLDLLRQLARDLHG